jgi:DNA helicase-2/ATP-dependent DNA helicase PcrA
MSKVIKIKQFVETRKALNPQQMATIAELEGRHVINSGAGTGKSTVLIERMKAIKAKYPEATILMLSFSKDSALELKSRVGNVTGVTISTLHSLAYHILQTSGWKFKVDCNSENQTAVITNLIGSKSKTTAEEVIKSLHNFESETVSTLRIRKKYLQWQKENHVVSFDTMILSALEMLQKHQGLRSYWQNRYDFIQNDEGQDLDGAQTELVNLISCVKNNLCVCGDQRQQIYSFRGASGAMQEFSQNAIVHELTMNYRCNQGILDLANSIMQEYSPLETAAGVVRRDPIFYAAKDSEDEASNIADRVEELHKHGENYKDIAVLYRSSSVTPTIAEEFLKRKIPFVTKSSFLLKYSASPYREIINLFKFMTDSSVDNLEKILPLFYLKKSKIEVVSKMVAELNSPLTNILPLLTEKPNHHSYVEELSKAVETATQMSPAKALRHLINHGLSKYFAESILAVENIIAELQKFTTIEDFLNQVSDLQEQMKKMRELSSKTKSAVQLMTIHASKGCEWSNVFIAGCNEGVLPSSREGADLAEEKRLLYVAVTRARENLYLSYPKFNENSIETNMPCRFIAGLF